MLIPAWLFFLLSPFSAPYSSEVLPDFTLLNFGIIEPVSNDSLSEQSSTVSSDVRWHFSQTTRQVPLAKGIEFGIEYTTSTDVPVKVLERVIFPEPGLLDPKKGVISTFSEIETEISSEFVSAPSFIMAEDWEVKAGTWKIQIIHNNRIQLETAFIVK